MKISINGMHCESCVKTIEAALAALHGVSSCTVRLNEAEVSYEDSQTDKAGILHAITDAGSFGIEGFSATD